MPEPSDDHLEPTESDPTEKPEHTKGLPTKLAEETVELTSGQVTERQDADQTQDANFRPGSQDDAEEGSGNSDDPTAEFSRENDTEPAARTRIRYLGDYELINILGRGGMGVVYRARQISLNRQVALKLIRVEGFPSESEVRRFQNEAEAVASLDHPGIVPIYEVGKHQGRHYFSMKLIQGKSLQEAAARLKGNFRAIATILRGSAKGIQHAHERGILHRDIKPGNILLDTEDTPHITDFGLAKRLEENGVELTQTGAVVGTPAYMAPEQASASRGTITTLTDVYGLGAVLYSLLAGRAPHQGSSMLEVLDAVRDFAPVAPSKINAAVPLDLDVICMKCLESDPRRRYASARELADDLNRWLEGRPITARPVGTMTQAFLWCKRKPLVAGLAAALLISAVAGSAGVIVNWLEVRRQRDQVRAEWENSRILNEFLISDLLAWSSPFVAERKDVPVSSLLDRSARLAASRFRNNPKIEGSIREALGHGYLALGQIPKAEAEMLQSVRIRASLPEGDELDRLSTDYVMAIIRREQGRYDEAETLATKAFKGRQARLGDSDVATLEAAEVLGSVFKLKGEFEKSRALIEKTASIARQALGLDHRVTLLALTDLAIIAYDQGSIAHDKGRIREAVATLNELAVAETRVFGVDHPETIYVRARLGAALLGIDDATRAEEVLAAVLEAARKSLGPEHPETSRIIANLAAVRAKLGKNDQAAEGMKQALQGQKANQTQETAESFTNEKNQAVILSQQGNLVEAEAAFRDLIARMRLRVKADDPTLGLALSSDANTLWELGKLVEAEKASVDGLEILRKNFPAEHPYIVNAEAPQASILLANRKYAESEKVARRVIEARSKPGAIPSPWRLGVIQSVLGSALAGQQKYDEAEKLLLEGFQTVQDDPKSPKKRLDESLDRVIQLYEAWDKPAEAERWRVKRKPNPDKK